MTSQPENPLLASSSSKFHDALRLTRRSWQRWALIIGIILLMMIAFFVLKRYFLKPKTDIIASLTESSSKGQGDSRGQRGDNENYQAVFLDNGQVYFGKLVATKGEFYRLESVFYFLQQTPAPSDRSKTADTSLTRLVNATHGPEDFMDIHTQHILFIENLRSDSAVLKAIQDYEQKKK